MNKNDFIDSHFYKYIYGDYIFYLKYKHSYSPFEYEIDYYYEIEIYDNEFVCFNDINFVKFSNKQGTYEEVDLSLIVEYLPIGHPDKTLFRKQRIKKLLYESN